MSLPSSTKRKRLSAEYWKGIFWKFSFQQCSWHFC